MSDEIRKACYAAVLCWAGAMALGCTPCAPVAIATAQKAAAAEPKEKTPEPVLPPSVLPVVFLSGSDYEMGYQYGRQAGAYIEINATKAWSGALQRYSREDLVRAVKTNQRFIRQYTPEHIDIIKGIADGASSAGYRVTYLDVLLINCTLPEPKHAVFPGDIDRDQLPPKKACSVCSAWGSATKGGRLMGLDTLDSDGDAAYAVVLVVYPQKGNAYICGAEAGEIGDHFLMNNKGLFIGNSGGGGSPRPQDEGFGLSWSNSLPYLARFADTAEAAKQMVMGWQINIPENFHLVDVHGNGFVVEKTAAVQAVRVPGDFGERDFLFSTNNYLHPKMKVTKEGEFIKQHGGFGAYSASRNSVLWDLLSNYHGSIDERFMKMILRFPGNPPPYPPRQGWDAKICRPTNSWVSVLLPDNGDKGVAHICTGPAGRVIHSSLTRRGEPLRSSYRYIDGTHAFFKLRLAKTPKAVTEQAREDARLALAEAYREFMQLTPKDSGFQTIGQILATANEYYYRGNLFLDKAMVEPGDEALFLLAEAASAYTHCQARAGQANEALVPPPTSPTDLGLDPFGGAWGTWETELGEPTEID